METQLLTEKMYDYEYRNALRVIEKLANVIQSDKISYAPTKANLYTFGLPMPETVRKSMEYLFDVDVNELETYLLGLQEKFGSEKFVKGRKDLWIDTFYGIGTEKEREKFINDYGADISDKEIVEKVSGNNFEIYVAKLPRDQHLENIINSAENNIHSVISSDLEDTETTKQMHKKNPKYNYHGFLFLSGPVKKSIQDVEYDISQISSKKN